MSLLYGLIALAAIYSLPQAANLKFPQEKYEPYLDGAAYDLGPRDKCVVFPVKKCAGIVGNKTRVPQFSAFLSARIDHEMELMNRTIGTAPFLSKECKDFVVSNICLAHAQPICNNDNTRVTYTKADGKTFERVEN